MEPTFANLQAIEASGRAVVAWQGIRVTVPADWEPGAFSGDWSSGHMRIDERLEARLVIRWLSAESTAKLFARSPSRAAAIAQMAANYLTGLERSYRKRRRTVSHATVDRIVPRRKLNMTPMSWFEWSVERDGTCGIGFTGECAESGRVLISELTGRDPAEVRRRAEEIYANLRPFPESDDSVLWSCFGLRFTLSREWTLAGTSLVGGKVEFRFAREDGARAAMQRWVANLALGKGDLVAWAKNQFARDLRGEFVFRMEKGRCRGHPAVLAEGSKRSPRDRAAHVARRVFRQETPFFLVARAWHCEPENRIYVVRTVCRESDRSLADSMLAHFACHFGD